VNTELSITFLNNVIFFVIAILACTHPGKSAEQKDQYPYSTLCKSLYSVPGGHHTASECGSSFNLGAAFGGAEL
jgi:hypothetical protein